MAKELKTFAQLIELLESRGVATDSTAADCLRVISDYAVSFGSLQGYTFPYRWLK